MFDGDALNFPERIHELHVFDGREVIQGIGIGYDADIVVNVEVIDCLVRRLIPTVILQHFPRVVPLFDTWLEHTRPNFPLGGEADFSVEPCQEITSLPF